MVSTAAAANAQENTARVRRIFRPPRGPRLFSLFGTIILFVVTAMMSVGAVFGFASHWALGIVMMLCAGLLGALTGYVWRDLRGKWGLQVVLEADAVTLDLPAGRSLIHRPPAQHLKVRYPEIEAIEARFESYSSLGSAMMQRAYVLRRKSGELIFLFEERALATRMASSIFADVVADLVARARVPLRELGTVEGGGGLLCVWGTQAPDWAARPLARQRAMQLWQHAAATGTAAMFIPLTIALILRAF